MAVYMLAGLFWSATLGICGMELRDITTRDYSHEFHHLLQAQYNGRDLFLCINGRAMHHPADPAEESDFSLSIPIAELWEDDTELLDAGFFRPGYSQYSVRLPLRQVSADCEIEETNYFALPVTELAETEDIGDYFDGYNKSEIERFIRGRSVRQEIIVIPQSFNATSYSQDKQIVFINNIPDDYGNRYIQIGVRAQRRDLVIGSSDVAQAMAIDAFTFPYQMFVWWVALGSH